MAISKDGVRVYGGEYRVVFAAACQAAQAMGMDVSQADATTGVITAKSSVSFTSWGENVIIKVWQEAPGEIQVSANSGLKFGLVDWGKNRKNLDKLFLGIDWALAADTPPPAAAVAPAAGWHPDPSGRHEHRYWDGQGWSDQVSDAGTAATDPL